MKLQKPPNADKISNPLCQQKVMLMILNQKKNRNSQKKFKRTTRQQFRKMKKFPNRKKIKLRVTTYNSLNLSLTHNNSRQHRKQVRKNIEKQSIESYYGIKCQHLSDVTHRKEIKESLSVRYLKRMKVHKDLKAVKEENQAVALVLSSESLNLSLYR